MELQPSWVLEDGTRIDLTAIPNRNDLRLFAHHHWSARVNDAAVPTDTRPIRGASSENFFKLPDGREAIARVLMLRGARVCELAIGDQLVLYPGKRPFSCPACGNPIEPQLRACIACKTDQPSYEERIRTMQRQALAKSLLQLNLGCIVLGMSRMLAWRPGHAFATLRSAEAATPHASLAEQALRAMQAANENPQDLQHSLTSLATYMFCVFGYALVALRAPAIAAVLNLFTLTFMFANHLLSFEQSWFAAAIGGFLMLSSILTAERGIEIAHASKQRSSDRK